jgi:RNA polymerase sigma factor (sigma-70 family)
LIRRVAPPADNPANESGLATSPEALIVTQRDAQIEAAVQANDAFVKAMALKLAPAPGLAGDIAQQVFLEFIEKRDKWDLSQDLKPLLATMTRNVAMRCWRERCKAMAPEMVALVEEIRTLAEREEVPWYSEEEKDALRRCLEKLPEKSRNVLKLHYDLGVSSVDMAQQMRVRADAVRRALFRLRYQLRRCVEYSLSRGSYA